MLELYFTLGFFVLAMAGWVVAETIRFQERLDATERSFYEEWRP